MTVVLSSVPLVRVRFIRTVGNATISPNKVTADATVEYVTVPGQHGYIDLVTVTSDVDPNDPRVGYLDLLATDDPDVLESFGWTVKFQNSNRPTRVVSVPQTGPNVEFIDVNGYQTPAVWLDQLATFTGPSGATGSDLATRTYVDDSFDAHEAAPDPHPGYALDSDVAAIRQVPSGGTTGQVVTKQSSGYGWADATSGGGGTPTGGAGGVLSGSYPNPGFAQDMATQAELDSHATSTSNPHAVTKGQVGLGNVDNTSDAAKPISTAQQAALDGKASLVSGKVPQSQLPAVALTDFLGVVASQAAMLALTGQRGDWATRTDRGTDWQLIADDSTQLASWREMTYPASPVSSVNGRTGAVTGLAESTDTRFTDARPWSKYSETTAPTAGQVPTYDTTSGTYKPGTPASGGASSSMPVWQPNTTYAAGDRVLAPSGVLAVRRYPGTSTLVYDPQAWSEIGASRSTLARLDVVESGWVPPAPGTSSAVARVPDGGGPRYFNQFPAAQEMADPSFFPLGVWSVTVNNRGDIVRDRDCGLNMYVNLYGGTAALGLVGADATMQVILQCGENAPENWPQILTTNPAQPGAERVVGWKLYDEVDMLTDAATNGIGYVTARAASTPPNDGRFRFNNLGKGAAFSLTEAQAAQFVNFQHVTSLDLYWFTDNDLFGQYQGGQIVFTDGDATTQTALTADQAHLGANYATGIRRLRRFMSPQRARPVWGFVELGHPFTDNSFPTIAPAEVASAAWHLIIAGATGILYFNHSFGGTTSGNVLRDANYTAIRAAVTALNARFQNLARVLNAPTVENFGATATGGSVAMSVRIVGGRYYLLAASKQRTSATVTFTLPAGVTATYATPLHENRAGIAITTGAFSDTFADHNAVHVYRLDSAQNTDPAPVILQHKVFDGFGVDRASTTTLGTPHVGPAWTSAAGSIGIDNNGEAYRAGGSNRFARVNSVGAGAAATRTVAAVVGASPRDVGVAIQTDSNGFNGYMVNFDPGDGRLAVEKWGGSTLLQARSPLPGVRVEIRIGAAGAHDIYYDGAYVGSFTDTGFTGNYDGLYMKEIGLGRIREFTVRS